MSDFPYERVVVTGASGFLGSHVVEALRLRGVEPVTPRHGAYDFVSEFDAHRMIVQNEGAELLIHLAALCGGIGLNQQSPAHLFYDNAKMGMQLMDQAYRWGFKKFVNVCTVCAYPKYTQVPFKESDLWNGYPEETNAPYGLAKKMLIVQSQAYRQQYGFNSINLLLANLYGPRDHFNLETSHVIPAIIRKCVEAVATGAQSISLWGTGAPTREFLHARDAAEAILLACERYDSSEPMNVGTGGEISIEDLALMIARLTGFRGRIDWDHSRPGGQPRRCLDTSRAEQALGWKARIRLEDGLRETIDWYRRTSSV
jgi:GDP-L-fucose synthase